MKEATREYLAKVAKEKALVPIHGAADGFASNLASIVQPFPSWSLQEADGLWCAISTAQREKTGLRGIPAIRTYKTEEQMGNPFVYYRIESMKDLKRGMSHAVSDLDWHADLTAIQKFYARFGQSVDPDEFDTYIGNPLAIMRDGDIVCFAIPLSFRQGETEIGGVATVPDQRNKGCCKALISEMAFRILEQGNIATLTTEKTNLPMQKAAEAIGMKRLP